MIVGTGSLAKLLRDRDGAIFFCSGVSNSNQVTEDDEIREIIAVTTHLLKIKTDCFFYFSSIMAPIKLSPYYNHKEKMENFIRLSFPNYNIIRLGNIWECTNPNTFLNYLRAHPDAKIKDEYKYMISAAQLNTICQSLPLVGKHEISIFSEMLTVKECLKR